MGIIINKYTFSTSITIIITIAIIIRGRHQLIMPTVHYRAFSLVILKFARSEEIPEKIHNLCKRVALRGFLRDSIGALLKPP